MSRATDRLIFPIIGRVYFFAYTMYCSGLRQATPDDRYLVMTQVLALKNNIPQTITQKTSSRTASTGNSENTSENRKRFLSVLLYPYPANVE